MTALDLDAIKARCEAATEGPWRSGGEQISAEGPERWSYPLKTMIRDTIDIGGGNWGGEGGGYSMERADAEFIAHARMDVPALVAEVERLTSTEALTAVLETIFVGHVLDWPTSSNLGYYRTAVSCSCGAVIQYGDHEGDPFGSFEENFRPHQIEAIRAALGVTQTPAPTTSDSSSTGGQL